MQQTGTPPLLSNVFWPLLPILAWNLLLIKRLPPVYRQDVVGNDIPKWIAIPENLIRFAVVALPCVLSTIPHLSRNPFLADLGDNKIASVVIDFAISH